MWFQEYNPIGNEILSGLVAVIPIVVFLLGLTVFKLKGTIAASLTLISALLITTFVYKMPIDAALLSLILGVGKALWPIGYIIIMAVWLYKMSVKSGKFDIVGKTIIGISNDQRIQLLVIGFCFLSFLEGVSGLGVPIAICSALLVSLGFHPIKAAGFCLISNAATGVFATVGIGVFTGAEVGNMPVSELSALTALSVPVIAFIVPFLLIFIQDGVKGVKEIFPALITVSLVFSVFQFLIATFVGPELTNIIPSLLAMLTLALVMRKWKPKNVYYEPNADRTKIAEKLSFKQLLRGWSPFYFLTIVIGIWSLPFFSKLFAENGPLSFTTLHIKIPNLHERIIQSAPIALEETAMPAIFHWDIISSTGTAILVAAIITSTVLSEITMKDRVGLFGETLKELKAPLIIIILVLSFASLSNYSGLSASIGLALANTGMLFPLFSPLLGWLGVFLTGSVVNNNALFAGLQVVTAKQLALNPSLFVAANTVGGAMAKPIAPTSLAIAAAAVGQNGKESEILSFTLKYSLLLITIICIINFVLAYTMT
ncbi:MAG TPA: lactate permease LctP family transporter [Jeotgalicoccus sp.]|nr:lactate permease LctP family transporter [Jeotgalicoccus sp.]